MDSPLGSNDDETPMTFPKIKPEFTVGSIVAIISMIIAGALWVGQVNSLGEQIKDLKDSTNVQLNSIQAQIANLPTETVQISVLQQHASATDQTLSAINQAIFDLKTQAIQNKADIENIERASSIPLKRK